MSPTPTPDPRAGPRAGHRDPQIDGLVRLLRGALNAAPNPIERLADRLAEGDRPEELLDAHTPAAWRDLIRGHADLPAVRAAYAAAKSAFQSATTQDPADAASLHLLLALAAGRVHHHAAVGRVTPATADQWLRDVADVTTGPVAEFLRAAAGVNP